ncbi:MAG TPA: dicarboxylate/amino acid:cation symporter [Candidatus Limnocylindrales bacterium]|nr:dicarboxylate/amino acid:cation symporter [Candidatus Limnocylindrales bacterium]
MSEGRLALHWKILLGLGAGAVLGLAGNLALGPDDARLLWASDNIAQPLGQIFLRLIFMVVLPLVFSALALGVVEIGDLSRLRRVGIATLLMTVLLSGASVGIGIGLVDTLEPGRQLSEQTRENLRERFASADATERAIAASKQAKPLRDVILDLIPKNPLQEMVGALDGSSPGGGMLAVMVFALLFGVAITMAPARTTALVAVLEGLYDVSMVIIAMAMKLAPVGVAGLVFALTATLGLEILSTLIGYVMVVLLALLLQATVVYSLALTLIGRVHPVRFYRSASDALVTAFGTSSSNATLPTSLRVAEEELHLPRDVSRFVLTVGSTANQNGTALYEGVTVLFLAQVFGVELSTGQQLTVVLLSILAGVGTAGVPGGSLPLVAILLLSVGIPAEGIGIILGVDRLLDMCRTALNVAGDLVIATCVNRKDDRVLAVGTNLSNQS